MATVTETKGFVHSNNMATVVFLRSQGHTNTERYEPKSPTLKPTGDQIRERKFFSFKNLQFEAVRLSTFKNWNVRFMDKHALAKNGFFYMQREDFVQCHFCRGVVGYWEKGDDPSVEHEKHFPNCPFVQGSAVTNIPHDGKPLNQMLLDYLMERQGELDPPMRKRLYQTDSAAIGKTEKPDQYPDYSSPAKRKASFPDTKLNIPDVDKMVDAGFFLIGLGDMAQCYSCGGGIFNWTAEEDPQVVHDSMYPNCSLAQDRNKEGQVDSKRISKRDSKREVTPSKKRRITGDEKSQLLELPLAKKLMGSGWPKEMVSGSLAYELNKYGTLPVDINEANDAIMDYEEMIEAGEPEDIY